METSGGDKSGPQSGYLIEFFSVLEQAGCGYGDVKFLIEQCRISLESCWGTMISSWPDVAAVHIKP